MEEIEEAKSVFCQKEFLSIYSINEEIMLV